MVATRRSRGGSRYAVIMAGGAGTRFWPHSRRRLPKQFLTLGGRRSLLQAAVERLRGVVHPARVLVVAPRDLAGLVRRQLPALPQDNLLVEPAARGTAACLAWAAAAVTRRDPTAAMAAMPADHVISDKARFRRCLARGFEIAEREDCSVAFGVRPVGPETGYGYIEIGAPLRRTVPRVDWAARFVEKPDRATAEEFVASGRYLWNAGIFVWRVPVLRAGLQVHAPEVARVMDMPRSGGRASSLAPAYRRLPVVSIDVALMERTERVAVVTAGFDWTDAGSWSAMPALWGVDADGNAARGKVLLVDSRGTVAFGATRLVAVVGAEDLIVVDSPDAVLVCPRGRAQDVRHLVERLARGPYRRLR